MPLGAFRLNSLAKAIAEASGPTARTASTVTPLDNVQINESIYKFGYGSATFDGSNDRIGVALGNSSGTSGAFTVESWCRFDILPSSQTIGGGSYMMLFTVAPDTYILVGDDRLQVADSGVYMTFNRPSGSLATNVWYHIAVTRDDSNVYRVFVDGVEYTPPASRTVSAQFCSGGTIGRFIDSRGSWDGYMDEFRISNVARYTTGFTPPTEPFVNDDDTLLLMHMNGPTGSTNFFDDNSTLASTNFADGGQEFIIKENDTIYRVHRVTSTSTFTVNEAVDADLLVVAGGGAGGGVSSGSTRSGGGGGGGEVSQSTLTLSPASYSITIGSGGTPTSTNQAWVSGVASSFDSLVSTEGGGGGGTQSFPGQSKSTAAGGGGGASGSGGLAGGTGTQNGGSGSTASGYPAGGGGSNANTGGNGSSGGGGPGANGVVITFLGGSSYIAAGGGGGRGGGGGLGGGGAGSTNSNGGAATANTGSGGGGAGTTFGSRTGGAGGSGIVMIRYPI